MKRNILVLIPVLLVAGALAFLLVRAERLIQSQQRAINDLSAKLEHLERNAAVRSDAGASASRLKTEVDELQQTVTSLQTQLAEDGKNYGLDLFDHQILGNGGVNNRTFKVAPNDAVMPNWPAPPPVARGAIPFEFNGMTYYQVPLASSH